MKRLQAAALAAALLLGLAGCAGAQSAAQPAPTPTAAPTATPEPTPTAAPAANPLTGELGDYTGRRPVAVALRSAENVGPYWGLDGAEVLIEGVTEGKYPSITAVYPSVDAVAKVGPVGPARDLALQLVLPLNAVPVQIGKNIYASNLLNLLAYQDLDGLHIGKGAFAFEDSRQASYGEENCWYTTADLIRAGLAQYGAQADGANTPLFRFGDRPAVAEDARNATRVEITFGAASTEVLEYDAATNTYLKFNRDGSPMADADSGNQAAFTNVVVLFARSGVKDDGYTRQYDLTEGDGIYLTGGSWQAIRWAKGDATAPLQLADGDGNPLTVACGRSFVAVWGGYYGQALAVLAPDGTAQALPAKPELLESGISDEAAAAAQVIQDAQTAVTQARNQLELAQQALAAAQETEDPQDDIDAQAAVDEAQAVLDAAQANLDGIIAQIAG